MDAHRDGGEYVMAGTSWDSVSTYIEATGQTMLPMGGFSGSVPEPTLAEFEQLVKTGRLRFVLSGGASGRGGASPTGTSSVSEITQWVTSNCKTVPAADYGGTATTTSAVGAAGFGGGFRQRAGGGGTLYQCSAS